MTTIQHSPNSASIKKYGIVKHEIDFLLEQAAINYKDEKYTALLDDLQAGILKHPNKKRTDYHFISFSKNKKNHVKKWLTNFSEHITSAKTQLTNSDKLAPILSICLTFDGYKYLDIPDNVIPEEIAFRAGLSRRLLIDQAEVQHDLEDESKIHAVIMHAYAEGNQAQHFSQAIQKLKSLATQTVESGLLHPSFTPENNFKDGISNPRFFPGAFNTSKIVQAADLPPMNLALRQDRGGNGSFSCGSYAAFAKFQVNEKAIKALADTIIHQTQGKSAIKNQDAQDLARAYMMGRFTDGTPVSVSDKKTGNAHTSFDYTDLLQVKNGAKVQDDGQGNRCPFFAHARKSNPKTTDSAKRRIVRRGTFYDNGKNKGLLFLSFQNSLEKQFEYIFNNWILNSNTYKPEATGYLSFKHTGKDILFATEGDSYEFPAEWNQDNEQTKTIQVRVPKTIVNFKGGLYLFCPSISFFTKLNNYPSLGNVKPTSRSLPSTNGQIKDEVIFKEGTEFKAIKKPVSSNGIPFNKGTGFAITFTPNQESA